MLTKSQFLNRTNEEFIYKSILSRIETGLENNFNFPLEIKNIKIIHDDVNLENLKENLEKELKSFGYDLEFNAYKAYDRTYTEFRYLIITIF